MDIETRKFLAPINLKKPEAQISGFLVVDSTGKFVEISSRKGFEAGIIVYVGRTITPETVCEKALKHGRNVDRSEIERLMSEIAKFRIGDIVGFSTESDSRLVKLNIERPRPFKLPK